jgi:hypothetical protein
MRNDESKVVDKIKTYTLYVQEIFYEYYAAYETMLRNVVEADRSHMCMAERKCHYLPDD